jgi:hypothetical protein
MPITIFQGIHAEKLYLNFRDLCRQSAPLTTAASEGGATTATHAVVDHCEWKGFEPVLLAGTTFPLQIRSFFPHQIKKRSRADILAIHVPST